MFFNSISRHGKQLTGKTYYGNYLFLHLAKYNYLLLSLSYILPKDLAGIMKWKYLTTWIFGLFFFFFLCVYAWWLYKIFVTDLWFLKILEAASEWRLGQIGEVYYICTLHMFICHKWFANDFFLIYFFWGKTFS